MSIEDDVKILVTLRNFESDSEYLHLGDCWIQKITHEDTKEFIHNLPYLGFSFLDIEGIHFKAHPPGYLQLS